MAETKIFIAGFGGQGVVLVGNIIAYAAMNEGKKILGMVSYGAEMRGGASSSSVIISEDEIDSPIIDEADILICLSKEAYSKFKDKIKKNGFLFIDSSKVNECEDKKNCSIINIPATEIAKEMGNIMVANIVMLGALIEKTKILKIESVLGALKKPFSGEKRNLIYINESALKAGIDLIKSDKVD